jgi:DNA-binding MarR family transcriptional regulator
MTAPLEGTALYVPYLIKRAQHDFKAAVDEALKPLGLSGAQFGVMRALSEEPDLSGAELARRLAVTAQSMNELLGVLVAHAYIERTPHPTHGRIVRTRLTSTGKRALAKSTAVVERLTDQMLSGLTPDEHQRFTRYLERCVAALEPKEISA